VNANVGERHSFTGTLDYRFRWYDNSDQVTIGGEVRERRYPQGPERDRTRDIAQLTASWTHSLPNGRTSFTLGGQLTQEWATQERPDFSTDPDLLLTRNDDLWHFGASLIRGFARGTVRKSF